MIGPNNSECHDSLCINKILSQENRIARNFTEKMSTGRPRQDIDVEIEFDEPYLHVPFPEPNWRG